ncbi:MAG TPA: mechanosensitive ion channel domain-containing protein [Thermoanaerobaculia bacterium]|nr:mechanosensitive ion channel domain-containing protein [Thermoanaerobaculia bacterium]
MKLLRHGLLPGLALVAAGALAGQESSPGPAAPAAPVPEPALPSVLEVVPQVLALEQEARVARQQLGRVTGAGSFEAEAAEVEERLGELRRGLEALPRRGPSSGDEILLLRRRIDEQRTEVESLLEQVSSRAASLGEMIERWRERKERFAGWQDRLASDPAYPSIQGRLTAGRRHIGELLGDLERAVPALVGRQQHLRDLMLDADDMLLEVRRLRSEWRRSLLRAGEPAMWQPAFGQSLAAASRDGFAPAGAFAAEVGRPTLGEGLRWLLALVLGVTVAWGLRRFHSWAAPEDPARRLLAHPGAVAFFLSVITAVSARPFGPGWPDLLRAVLLAAAISLLAASIQRGWHRRLAVYLLAAGLLAQASLEAFAVAAPLYRLVVLGFAVLALPLVLVVVRKEVRRSEGRRTPFLAVARLGAVGLASLAVAELVGYHALGRWLWKSLLGTLILIFVAHFLVRLVASLLRLALASPAAQSRPLLASLGPELERRATRAVKVLVVVLGLLTLADFWDLVDSPLQAWERATSFGFTAGGSRFTLANLLLAAGVLYAALLVSWLLRTTLEEAVGKRGDFDPGARESAKTLLHYGLITIGFLLALSFAGVDLRNVTILAGALGVGLGFGLQNIFNNFVSGMILLFERPVRQGDLVEVGGDLGTVRRIGLRSTVLETVDRSEIVVPNSQLISEKVTNWTLSSRSARLVIPVGVAYGTDLGRVREVLEEVAVAHPGVLADPPPVAVPLSFGDSAIQCELRVWVANADDRPRLLGALIERVGQRFAEEGIAIPFPQVDVHLVRDAEEKT